MLSRSRRGRQSRDEREEKDGRVENGRLTADMVKGMEEKNGLLSDNVSTAAVITPSFPFG